MSTWASWDVKCATSTDWHENITKSDTAHSTCTIHSTAISDITLTETRGGENLKLDFEDSRQVVAIGRYPEYYNGYFTGEGDDYANGLRKGGQNLVITRTNAATGELATVVNFVDPISLMSGSLVASGANIDDYFTFRCVAPATPIIPNGGGTGNCDLDVTGRLIPVVGTGAYDVNLTEPMNANLVAKTGQSLVTKAAPVPAKDADGLTPVGYYNWDEATGAITPSYSMTGYYDLYPAEVVLTSFVNKWRAFTFGNEYVHEFDINHRGSLFLPQWFCRIITTWDIGHNSADVITYIFHLNIARRRSENL